MDMSTSTAEIEATASAGANFVDRPLSSVEARIDRVSRAVLLALAVAVGLAVIAAAGLGSNSADSASSGGSRLGGDFPAFYAAGSIVRSGDIDSLYDPARQLVEQSELGLDGYLAFAYPPHVAAAYAPLSALPYRYAYLVHTVLMAVAVAAALHVLSVPVPLLRRWKWPLLAAGFTFYPLFTAVGGGQNASLSLLLLALVWRGLHDDRAALAGVAAGLMFYRPQYALPVIGLLLIARQTRAAAWAVGVALATWAATAAFLGGGWVSTWFEEVIPFVEQDADVNAPNSISILGFLQAAWTSDGRPAVVLGAVGASVIVLVLMWLWWQPARFSLSNRMGALALGMILISPHTMFYDATVMLIAGAALLAEASGAGSLTDPLQAQRAVRLIVLVWVATLLHLVSEGIGATPLALVAVAAFGGFAWRVVTQDDNSTQLAGVN
jgi:hypothetical protein